MRAGVLESFVTLIERIGLKRLAIMGGVSLALIGGLIALSLKVSEPRLGYLYTDMEPAQAQAVVDKLRSQNIPYELGADGRSILAPEDRITSLRMQLAGEELGGAVGYELLDKQDMLGTTSFLQNVNHVRAMEGELARTIGSLNAVREARVHLVIPQRELFETEVRKPSASIKLTTSGRLTTQQVNAVRYLVSSAVPGLEPGRISIVDQSGALLARADGGADTGLADGMDERRSGIEQGMRGEIEAMLERIVGPGKVRAEVTADIEVEQVRQESEQYDPDKQVVARTTTVEHSNASSDKSQASSAVSVATNLPGQQPPAAPGDSSDSNSNETSEQTEFANSKTVTTTIRGSGSIKRLSVAVLVDGSYNGEGAKQAYTPRTAKELEQFTRLVQSAVGYNAQRGDTVVVENIRFISESDPATLQIAGLPLGLEKADLLQLAEVLGLGLIGVLALFLIVRPTLSRLKEGSQTPDELGADGAVPQLAAPAERLALAPPDGGSIAAELIERAREGDEEAIKQLQDMRNQRDGQLAVEHEIDVAQIDGKVKASALRKVGDVIRGNPRESAEIVRQWIYN